MRPTRALVLLAAASLVLAACTDDDTPSPTESPNPTPTATASVPEPTPSPTSSPIPTSSETAALEQPAIWPESSVVFDTPEAAAEDFVTNALGVPASLGEFQQGDSRSGEIAVFFPGEGGGTPVQRGLLLLRQLAPTDGWFVTAAPNDVTTIATPEQAATVPAAPVTVEGLARGFEANVVISGFVAGDANSVLDQQITEAGAFENPEPYSVTLDLSDATPGEIVAILVQGGTGHEADPGDFAAIAVTIEE